jgi:adenine/guanine/hypoxanthine permease
MFFAPIIGIVPPEATAPALITVGFLMMTALTEAEEEAAIEQAAEEGEPPPPVRRGRKLAGIDFSDLGIGLAAALTIMVMPFSFSIADGIGFGFVAYVVVRAAQSRWREVHPFMWVASAFFALYFLVPVLQDNYGWI